MSGKYKDHRERTRSKVNRSGQGSRIARIAKRGTRTGTTIGQQRKVKYCKYANNDYNQTNIAIIILCYSIAARRTIFNYETT